MNKKLFTVTATGDTFSIKDELKSWGFAWVGDEKAWVKPGCDEGQVNLFRHWARAEEWDGVNLDVREDAPVGAEFL